MQNMKQSTVATNSIQHPVDKKGHSDSYVYPHCEINLLPVAPEQGLIVGSNDVHRMPVMTVSPEISFLDVPVGANEENVKESHELEEKETVEIATSDCFSGMSPNNQTTDGQFITHNIIRVPEYEELLMEIEADILPNNLTKIGDVADLTAVLLEQQEPHVNVEKATGKEEKLVEMLNDERDVEDDEMTSLSSRVDRWADSIEEMERKAEKMAQDNVELRGRLENLLSELSSAQEQISDAASCTAQPSSFGASCPPQHHVLSYACDTTAVKDNCCKNNMSLDCVSRFSEDDDLNRSISTSVTVSNDDDDDDEQSSSSSYCYSFEDAYSEDSANLSDSDALFEEDVDLILHCLLSNDYDFVQSEIGSECSSRLSCIEEEGDTELEQMMEEDTTDSNDPIPDAMQSAHDMEAGHFVKPTSERYPKGWKPVREMESVYGENVLLCSRSSAMEIRDDESYEASSEMESPRAATNSERSWSETEEMSEWCMTLSTNNDFECSSLNQLEQDTVSSSTVSSTVPSVDIDDDYNSREILSCDTPTSDFDEDIDSAPVNRIQLAFDSVQNTKATVSYNILNNERSADDECLLHALESQQSRSSWMPHFNLHSWSMKKSVEPTLASEPIEAAIRETKKPTQSVIPAIATRAKKWAHGICAKRSIFTTWIPSFLKSSERGQ